MIKNAAIPKQLWLYWHQGWTNAPSLVQQCLRSWEEKNPTWAIHRLDAHTVRQFVSLPAPLRDTEGLPLCALADVIRVNLLSNHGGVWTDATVFCQRPLDQWIHAAAVTGFFAYDRPHPERPLASWFIASTAGHHLVEEWKKRVLRLWIEEDYLTLSRDRWSDWTPSSCPDHYFWFHGLFREMIEQDEAAARLWDAVEKVRADAPHFVQFSGMLRPMSSKVKAFIDHQVSPVHKLTYRYEEAQMADDSGLLYLLEQ